MLAEVPSVTTLTVTAPAACAGMDEISRLVPLTTVKQPGAEDAHSTTVVGVPALNWAAVPISMAVAAFRPVPVILTSLPPPAAPLVGVMAVTVGAEGTVPAGALEDVAGLASVEDATALVADWTWAWVTLLEVTTAFTVIVPLVNGVLVLVHEIDCPLGAAQVQPVPEAPTGTTPAGRVCGHRHRLVLRRARGTGRDRVRDGAATASVDAA